jgi:hypothetical protein
MLVRNSSDGRRDLWRSRWAAIGAAVAVTLGGGGLLVANAASSVPSSVVTITPVRKLDTRTGLGLVGPFQSMTPRKLTVTGGPVPVGATGVLLNVTVVAPSAGGFLSVRPGNATGLPSTSSLNFQAGDVVPNSVQVALPTSGPNRGQIDITYDAYGLPGQTAHVLADVVGYLVAGGATSATAPKVTTQSRFIDVEPFGFARGDLSCPSGYIPVGTGFASAGDLNIVLLTSTGVGYFLTNDGAVTLPVAIQVSCMSGATLLSSAELSVADEEVQAQLDHVRRRYDETVGIRNGD